MINYLSPSQKNKKESKKRASVEKKNSEPEVSGIFEKKIRTGSKQYFQTKYQRQK